MTDDRPFASSHRRVLDDPEHTRGLDRTEARILSVEPASSTVVRVLAEIGEGAHDEGWTAPNVAIRLELEDPGAAGSERVSRVYTVRRFDPATRVMEVDVVLHPHRTPVMAWIADLRVGDRVPVVGPRPHVVPTPDDRPVLLVADDTGLPAVHSLLASWPAGRPGRIATTSTDDAVLAELPRRSGVVLERIDSVDALVAPSVGTVWGAGERDEMRRLRDRCRAAGLARGDVRVFGYWKRGVSNSVVDRHRLDHFAALRAAGLGFEGVDDFDVDI